MASDKISIEVVYGTPHNQQVVALDVPVGTTVEQGVTLSKISELFPEVDTSVNKLGLWNKICRPTQILNDGDRIEVYRPLIADPKEVRKKRAEKAKLEGRADKVTGGRPDKQRGSGKP